MEGASGAGDASTKSNPVNGAPDGNNADNFQIGTPGAYTAPQIADILYYIYINGWEASDIDLYANNIIVRADKNPAGVAITGSRKIIHANNNKVKLYIERAVTHDHNNGA